MKESFKKQVEYLEQDWANNERWNGIKRDYSAEDVVRLRGSILPQYSLAEHGAKLLWERLHEMDYVHALGALTGGQAIQYVKAGLPA
ncbi:MAG: isocitrate lyase, partial [Dehalococcoidia bacterium]|nr:isocitrate lyase [Dehalococcoidia bacterium]